MKEKKQKDKGQNKTKVISNYITLIILFLTCMGIVLYISKLYRVKEEEMKKIPVIHGVLSEIYQEDLEHYIMDTPQTVIYMCKADEDECRMFEKKLKKLIEKKDVYKDQLIYLNLTDVDQEAFINSFNNIYKSKTKLTANYPAFVIFEDGKAIRILQGDDEKSLTINKVKEFLEMNKIGE